MNHQTQTPANQWPTTLPLQKGDVVRLKHDLTADFKAGDVVTVIDWSTTRKSPQDNVTFDTQDWIANDAIIVYGVAKREIVESAVWYRTKNAGRDGAPSHVELALSRRGPMAVERLDSGQKIFLKKAVTVFSSDHRTADMMQTPADTRCFVVNATTRVDSNEAYLRPNTTLSRPDRVFYRVQVKVLTYEFTKIPCDMRTLGSLLPKVPPSDARRWHQEVPPKSKVVSVVDGEAYTVGHWGY